MASQFVAMAPLPAVFLRRAKVSVPPILPATSYNGREYTSQYQQVTLWPAMRLREWMAASA